MEGYRERPCEAYTRRPGPPHLVGNILPNQDADLDLSVYQICEDCRVQRFLWSWQWGATHPLWLKLPQQFKDVALQTRAFHAYAVLGRGGVQQAAVAAGQEVEIYYEAQRDCCDCRICVRSKRARLEGHR